MIMNDLSSMPHHQKRLNGCGNKAALLETLCERKEERVTQLQSLLQDRDFFEVHKAGVK